MRRCVRPLVLLALGAILGVGCGARMQISPPVAVPITETNGVLHGLRAEDPPSRDPVVALIASSDFLFREGERELELGHVDAARLKFDEAVNLLLESPYGGRTEPRIREHFDHLIDRISAYELRTLAEGDGFTEQQYEPASIDELLAVSESVAAPTGEGLQAAASDPVIHDVPIEMNARVLAFIELFQNRLHSFLEEGMRRGSEYLPMIQSIFRSAGVPLDLAYIPLVESAFKPNALSRARAKGVWQFVSRTGREHGLRQDWYVDERSDPIKSTQAAAQYLLTLSQMFGGDWNLALASYNGGPGTVQRAIRRSGQRDFWKLAARPGLLPRETRNYVPMVLAAIVIARNPAQYGFEFEALPTRLYEMVSLPRPVDLRKIAEWAGTTVDDIQAINPELRRWTTPVRDASYSIRVPLGTADFISLKVEEAESAELASLRWHTVKSGESLALIARRLKVSRTDLAEANFLSASARVTPGQRLIIPHEPTVLMTAAAGDGDRAFTPDVVPASATVTNTPDRKVTYRVKRGDTLISIARSFGTSVQALQEWNGITGTKILLNQSLVIYNPHSN